MQVSKWLGLTVAVAALAVPAQAVAAPGGLKLHPTAGRANPPDYKTLGNGTSAQAQWTNKEAHSGKFSVLLQKTAPTADYAYAAVIVKGVEGMTLADVGTIGFWVKGYCGGGAPRFNLFYDNDGDGQWDGYAFYGCNSGGGVAGPSWSQVTHNALVPDATVGAAPTAASTVVSLSVLSDETGTSYVDDVTAGGMTVGEPNGG